MTMNMNTMMMTKINDNDNDQWSHGDFDEGGESHVSFGGGDDDDDETWDINLHMMWWRYVDDHDDDNEYDDDDDEYDNDDDEYDDDDDEYDNDDDEKDQWQWQWSMKPWQLWRRGGRAMSALAVVTMTMMRH